MKGDEKKRMVFLIDTELRSRIYLHITKVHAKKGKWMSSADVIRAALNKYLDKK